MKLFSKVLATVALAALVAPTFAQTPPPATPSTGSTMSKKPMMSGKKPMMGHKMSGKKMMGKKMMGKKPMMKKPMMKSGGMKKTM